MTTTKQSTWGATLRTTILMATLGGLLVAIGFAIGGAQTATIFLFMALAINFFSYFFSDKMALAMSRAQPIDEAEAPRLYQIMRELTTRAGLPMPRLYMIPQDQPNAFATAECFGLRSPVASPSCSPRTSCAASSRTSSPTSATATS